MKLIFFATAYQVVMVNDRNITKVSSHCAIAVTCYQAGLYFRDGATELAGETGIVFCIYYLQGYTMSELQLFENENLLPANGDVRFYPAFFTTAAADIHFNDLQHNIAWRQEPVKIFGREVMQPRLTAWYGDAGKSYSYSGITMQPHPWTPALLNIKNKVDEAAKVSFNSALLNLYRNGNDSMGWHRDNEKELGTDPVIASVSFGAARRFLLRSYNDKKITREILLTHGSMLLMRGATQHYWEHSIPKTARPTGSRINITFRIIL